MVKINDSYYVRVEDKNLTLQRINGIDKRSGKPKYSIIGYFSNWQVLFDKLIKLFVADNVNMENTILLSQLKEIYEDVRKEIKHSLQISFESWFEGVRGRGRRFPFKGKVNYHSPFFIGANIPVYITLTHKQRKEQTDMPKRLKWGTIQYLEQLVNEYFDTHLIPTIAGLCLHLGITNATWKHYLSQRYRRLKCSAEEFEEYQTKKDEDGIFQELIEISANSYVVDSDCQSIDDDAVKAAVSNIFQTARQLIEARVSEAIFSAKNPAGAIFYSKCALGYRENDVEAGKTPIIPATINIVVMPPPEKPKQFDETQVKQLP